MCPSAISHVARLSPRREGSLIGIQAVV